MSKTAAVILLTIVVLAGACFVVYRYEQGTRAPQSVPTTYASVANMNAQTADDVPDFAAAVQLESKHDYSSAITQLQSALPSAQNASQALTITFHLEQDNVNVGNFTNAVQFLRNIASTNSYEPITRAFAVEQMAVLYATYKDPNIAASIFSGEPYESLRMATSTNLTARNLFQYAATIYVLPVSEYSIANAYANSALALKASADTAANGAKIAAIEKNLNSSFEAGDAALPSVEQTPPVPNYALSAQLIRATVLGKMQQIGDATSTSGGAQQAFQNLLDAYASQGITEDGAVRLQYACFLANVYGASQSANIAAIVQPLYQDPADHAFFVEPVLEQYAGAPLSSAKANLILVASLDPQFKAFLVSLGWTSADFSTDTPAAAQ